MKTVYAVCGALICLAGCAGPKPSIYYEADRTVPQIKVDRPEFAGYGAAVAAQDVPWSPKSLAQDFVDLNFASESGQEFDRLRRWRSGVSVALAGSELAAYRAETLELIEMIAKAAPALDLSLVDGDEGDITLRTAPYDEMRALAPTAQCFIVAGAYDWPGYRRAHARGDDRVEWVSSGEATIFIPALAAPVIYRECIVEEIMQALGPSNDLYALEGSVFNDDNAHLSPTRFDLLMLAILYAPELKLDMSLEEAQAAAEQVVRRIGSHGSRDRQRSAADDRYQARLVRAGKSNDPEQRVRLIKEALAVAKALPEDDHRQGEARRSLMWALWNAGDGASAIDAGRRAVAFFETHRAADDVRLARVRSDLGYLLYIEGDDEAAIDLLGRSEPTLAAHRIDDEFAFTLRLRALSLARLGRKEEAETTAKSAMDWARYTFGGDSSDVAEWRKLFTSKGLKV